MKIAFLINERALRDNIAHAISHLDVSIDHYSTASKALAKLTAIAYDLVVIHWKVYPGLGCGDATIDDYSRLIPETSLNTNLLYWEVGLRVIDVMRDVETVNHTTAVILLFPDLPEAGFCIGDQLTRDSVCADVATRQPAVTLFKPSTRDVTEAIQRTLMETRV
jgi:hypothetical protein